MKVVKTVFKGLFLGVIVLGTLIMNFIGAIICAITQG